MIDRLGPAYSPGSMTCLPGIAPGGHHCRHARLGVDKYAGLGTEVAGAFADSKGRYGYRRIKAVLRTGVSEKSVRRIMAEEGLVAHVPKRRRYGSYEGETTPAPANLVDRDFTAERPNEKWLTDITEIKARDGKGVPLAAGRTASMARSSHTPPASAPTRSWPTGCRRKRPRRCRGTRVPWCIPTVDATAGGPDGSGSWNASG
ncbi:MAG: IS3 family transposase [Bifidobacterium longum]